MKFITLFLSIILLQACSKLPASKEVIPEDSTKGEWVDSVTSPLFMGLTNEQWKAKDAPYWWKIDSTAIARAGGIYSGDLPSSMCCPGWGNFMGDTSFSIASIYHPSVDSTEERKHIYFMRKPAKKK